MAGGLFIYGLVCPISSRIFYVGQTTDVAFRLKTHMGSPYSNAPKLANYLNELKMKKRLKDLTAVVLQECRTRDAQRKRETYWIKKLSETAELMNSVHNKNNDLRVVTMSEYIEHLKSL